ncbi:MAG: hypothetical protein AAB365_03655 [Patescibacteria group bacterium]
MNATSPKNPRPIHASAARTILETEVFSRYGACDDIEHLQFQGCHYTDALIAPLRGAPGLWLVFMWVQRENNFSLDACNLEIVSPDTCARTPLDLTNPHRVVHLRITANRYSAVNDRLDVASPIRLDPMALHFRSSMPTQLDLASDTDRVVLGVLSFVMERVREERANEVSSVVPTQRALHVAPQVSPVLTTA